MELPLDISVKKGVCLIGVDKVDEAQTELQTLWSETFIEYGDLYLDVAEAWREAALRPGNDKKGLLERALNTYDSLEAVER